ncbi:MAG: carotenoid oxygenase family protein [Sphingopyxis sp.]|nr:carotenoid oxygenase family protein [Sphingopyxis sp.]
MMTDVAVMIRKTVSSGVLALAGFNRRRMAKSDAPHPYLSGIHAPLPHELTLDDLAVTGTIPPALDGRYIRIGPNPVKPPHAQSYHWFLGDGMVHGVRIAGGRALWYRNRWIRSTAVTNALGEPPAPGPRRGRVETVNTNVIHHAGATYAIVEGGGAPVRIDEELATVAHDPFGGTLKGSFTAHPHLDPDSEEMHAITYDAMDPAHIHHVVVDAAGKVRREEAIAVAHGPMIHDCMITNNYVVILDLPVTFSPKTLLAGYGFPYAWNEKHRPRIGLLPREGRGEEVIWCSIDPCFVFHPCNAFENADGTVTMDVCAHDSMFATSRAGPDSAAAPFERWTIDPARKQVSRHIIDAEPQEFPRPNEARIGKPYRYAYTMALDEGFDAASQTQTRLFKHDLERGTRSVHDFGPDRIPGEFVFIPRNGTAQQAGEAEDDGWMMGYVVNLDQQTTDLVIIDAAQFDTAPVATIHIPHRIPPGFHGNWVPSGG